MSNSQHSFYFGKPGGALLGVYYPPLPAVAQRSQGIVLCPAFGQEYLRSHRAFRQLGLLLAREGFHVLRFDYFGSGDSEGLLEQANIMRWIGDISSARKELFNISGASKFSLVGLRLGASLGLLHAGQRRDEPWHTVTLWEPVVSGTDYLRDFDHYSDRPVTNIMGFPVTEQLREEIAAIDLLRVGPIAANRIDCVTSMRDAKLAQLLQQLSASAKVSEALIPIDGDWSKTDEFLSAMLPRQMILRIVQGLTQPEAA